MPIDTGRMEITLMRGNVVLTGTVKNLRSHPLVNIKDTVDELERRLRRDQRIKHLSVECRLMQAEKKEVQHFAAGHFEHKEVEEESGETPSTQS
jgi:hypothetical protein